MFRPKRPVMFVDIKDFHVIGPKATYIRYMGYMLKRPGAAMGHFYLKYEDFCDKVADNIPEDAFNFQYNGAFNRDATF